MRRASEILRSGLDLVFRVDASPEARAESALAAARAGLTEAETGGPIVRAFAKAAADLLSRGLTAAFVLTGGAMARAALQEFGSGGMELCGEVEPGIPFGRLMDLENCLAVTKAGAFGTPQALCTACALLKKE